MVILSCDEHLRSTCYLLGTVLSTRLRLGSHFIAWGQRHERWENGREHVSILSLDSGKRYDHLYKQRWKVESEGVFFSRGLLWALGFKHVWCFAVVGTQEAAPWTVALGHQTSLKQAEHIASRVFPDHACATSWRLPEVMGRDFEEESDVLFQQMRANYPATGNWYHYELICSQRQQGLWHSWHNTHNTFCWF